MSFSSAFAVTSGHEGGYANDPVDRGGETYRGIARNFHRTWDGWDIIDTIKSTTRSTLWNEVMRSNVNLTFLVEDFYKKKFWDVWSGDAVDAVSPAIASEIYDSGVNMGVKRPVKFLQRALNLMDRGRLEDIAVDGKIGPATLSRLRLYCPKDEDTVLGMLNVLQGMHYIRCMERRSSQEKYARGWFKRVVLV